jgi:hypothetical protein
MFLTPSDRFRAYVERTTRPEARKRRSRLVHELNEHFNTSVLGLVNAVGGNAGDRTWVARAIRDGEIVRSPEGWLRLRQGSGLAHDQIVERAAACAAEVELLIASIPDEEAGEDPGYLLTRAARALQLVAGALDDPSTEYWRRALGLDQSPRASYEVDDREEGDEDQ